MLIVGWYGTETVGDKAILGGIVQAYHRSQPGTRITVASLHPFLTRQTARELGDAFEVIPVYGFRFIYACMTSQEVVMGGGPLMNLEELSIPLWAFRIARLFGHKRIIWGCGIGPLSQPRYIKAVEQILALATEIKLRDHASVVWANRLSQRDGIHMIPDPSRAYVASYPAAESTSEANVLACFLRDWPDQYIGERSLEEFHQTKAAFEYHLTAFIADTCQEYGLQPKLYGMSTSAMGIDDRVVNRRLIHEYLPEASYDCKPSSVGTIIQAMKNARLCVCMRFHSVVFAHTLGVPYIAIDYTNGGKIEAFLEDEQAMDRYVALQDIASGDSGKWAMIVKGIFDVQ